MKVTIEQEGKGQIILNLSGRLVEPPNKSFEEEMEKYFKEGVTTLLINLSFVNYINSTGMFFLRKLSDKIKEKKGAMVVYCPSAELMSIFKIAGFDRLLKFVNSLDEAHQYLLEKKDK